MRMQKLLPTESKTANDLKSVVCLLFNLFKLELEIKRRQLSCSEENGQILFGSSALAFPRNEPGQCI